MSNPLDSIATLGTTDRVGAASLSASAPGAPAARPRQGRAFAEVLAAGPVAPVAPEAATAIPVRLRELGRSIASGERALDRVIAQAASGKDFSTPELIAIQARVYRYSQELELVSKLVDKACAGVKQTLQTQV